MGEERIKRTKEGKGKGRERQGRKGGEERRNNTLKDETGKVKGEKWEEV